METFLKSACVFAEGSELDLVDIVPLLERAGGVEAAKGTTGDGSGPDTAGMLTVGRLADVERQVIEARLAHFDGNKRQTAASLGIDRGTLYNKIRSYGLVT